MSFWKKLFGGKTPGPPKQTQANWDTAATPTPPPPKLALAKNNPGRIHGLFNVATMTELASGRRCLMCGGQMQRSGSGFSLKCSTGHEQLAFFAFDNSYCTQSKRVAEALPGRGCRVEKAQDGERWSIFVQ
jgi:hypothetical protein